jgi:NitT/TauT family transport system ATP-binding protein
MANRSTTPIIEFEHVSEVFKLEGNEIIVLDDMQLTVDRNKFTSIVGPSGCGKTTLLRLASGLVGCTGGRTLFKGKELLSLNQDVGFVTQDSNLFPWLTMIENIEFPLVIRGIPAGERRGKAQEWIHRMGLEGFERHYPFQLSGGMQKRASIARTMIYEPDVILMDEPFGSLDAQTRMSLQKGLLDLWNRDKKTILFVTHDLVEAIALSDTIVVMTKRPGKVKDIFPVPLARPRNVFEIYVEPGFEETYSKLWNHFKAELP